jgi:hypothetical protein
MPAPDKPLIVHGVYYAISAPVALLIDDTVKEFSTIQEAKTHIKRQPDEGQSLSIHHFDGECWKEVFRK